jgi:TorA maturation chaperone TorD
MFMQNEKADRSEAYRLLSDLFLKAPDAGTLEEIREDLGLTAEEDPGEVLAEYSSLLAYPGGTFLPIESPFLSGGGLDVQDAVLEYYAQAGLTLAEELQLPPDHLSLELLFVSYLIDSDKPDLLERFLEEHIMNWVPYYCDELAKQASTVFYREVARITKEFLEIEYEGLE